MSSKMDRAGVRTPAQLEQKYGLGKLDKSFAEVLGIAEDARNTAADAQNTAAEAKKTAELVDENLNHEEIFNRLTNNGEVQGMFEENNQFYFNGSYIKTGKMSADRIDTEQLFAKDLLLTGTFTNTAEAFIEPGMPEINTIRYHNLGIITIPNERIRYYDFNNDGVVDAIDLLMARRAYSGTLSLSSWSGAVKSTITAKIDLSDSRAAIIISGVNMWGREVKTVVGLDESGKKSVSQIELVGSGENYQTVVDCWSELPNWSTWSCTVKGLTVTGAAFGYRVDTSGYFIYFDCHNSTAKLVLVQEGNATVRDV